MSINVLYIAHATADRVGYRVPGWISDSGTGMQLAI
jgi:hypothetical protein